MNGWESRPPIWQLPLAWWKLMCNEWQRRTWWGKVLYPIWVLEGVLEWVLFLTFFVFILAASWLVSGLSSPERSTEEQREKVLPEVYKDDAE